MNVDTGSNNTHKRKVAITNIVTSFVLNFNEYIVDKSGKKITKISSLPTNTLDKNINNKCKATNKPPKVKWLFLLIITTNFE